LAFKPKVKIKRFSKYKSKITIVDGIRFHSKKEANYYLELKARQQVGEFKYFLRQVPFHLPGDVIYRCDFAVVDNDDKISYWEVKGFMTDVAKIKISMTEELYGVKINIV